MRLISVPPKGTRKCYHKEEGFKEVEEGVAEGGEVEAAAAGAVDEGMAAVGAEEVVVIGGGEEEAVMVREVDKDEEDGVEPAPPAQKISTGKRSGAR